MLPRMRQPRRLRMETVRRLVRLPVFWPFSQSVPVASRRCVRAAGRSPILIRSQGRGQRLSRPVRFRGMRLRRLSQHLPDLLRRSAMRPLRHRLLRPRQAPHTSPLRKPAIASLCPKARFLPVRLASNCCATWLPRRRTRPTRSARRPIAASVPGSSCSTVNTCSVSKRTSSIGAPIGPRPGPPPLRNPPWSTPDASTACPRQDNWAALRSRLFCARNPGFYALFATQHIEDRASAYR